MVGVNATKQVLATNGDTHLGGEDFDQRVMQHFIKLFNRKTGVNIAGDNKATQKLRSEVRSRDWPGGIPRKKRGQVVGYRSL